MFRMNFFLYFGTGFGRYHHWIC